MENTVKNMHLAAQYLAAAGINFVPKTADDSHTNLGFSIENQRLETHPLSEKGDVLSLHYKNVGLQWTSQNNTESLVLDGTTHEAVLQWLQEVSQRFLGKSYSYGFHYDLPYEISDDYKFDFQNTKRLGELVQLRILAQSTFEETLASTGLESPIRIWPHHFDSGAYASLNAHSAVGFGLAIPDSVGDEHYFYISGYKGHDAISTDGFSRLSKGEWKKSGFTGAILPAKNTTQSEAVLFFTEAIKNYRH